jgi:hypothetical protein
MSTKEQKDIFEYQMDLAKKQYDTQHHINMIKDKITPQVRKKFSQAIKNTKETGKEYGFHLCIEKDGKLSVGDTCIGDDCSIKLHQMHMPCSEKKAQGDFHTHPYLVDAKKYFGITFKASDKLMKSTIRQFLDEKGFTVTMPSHADARNAILGKCSKKTEGTTCIGSDLEDNRVECWTPKDIGDDDCLRALIERLELSASEDKESTLPHEWIRPLFNIEMIDLKSARRKSSDKR